MLSSPAGPFTLEMVLVRPAAEVPVALRFTFSSWFIPFSILRVLQVPPWVLDPLHSVLCPQRCYGVCSEQAG